MRALVGTALVLALAATGCGGGSEDTAAPEDTPGNSASSDGSVDAGGGCTVLSAEDVEDITGADIADASELPDGCQWNLADAGPTGAAAYDFQRIDAAAYDSNLETAEAAGFTVEPVEGIGEEGFWRLQVNTEGATTNGELWVHTGDGVFYVRTQGIEYGGDIRDHQREIAMRVLEAQG